jgi:hypothetical protein
MTSCRIVTHVSADGDAATNPDNQPTVRNRVALNGQLLNPPPALCQLADLAIGTPEGLVPENARPAPPAPRPKSRTARPLEPVQVDTLLASYQTGKTMKDLATEFGIDRRTVSTHHLRQAGIGTRRGGLDENQMIEAAQLYEADWSSGRLAERFGVSADKVLKMLWRAGVAIRPRRG